MGLIDVEKLSEGRTLTPSDEPLTPSQENFDPSLTPHCSPFDPPLTPDANEAAKEESSDLEPSPPKNAHQAVKKTPVSYSEGHRSRVPLSAAGAD